VHRRALFSRRLAIAEHRNTGKYNSGSEMPVHVKVLVTRLACSLEAASADAFFEFVHERTTHRGAILENELTAPVDETRTFHGAAIVNIVDACVVEPRACAREYMDSVAT
jgi:hypothetical protein